MHSMRGGLFPVIVNSRKVVLLYNPQAVFFDLPLALLSVGSVLDPERYEVVIVDGRIDKNPLETLRIYIDRAICLGVTALTGSPLRNAISISRQVKALRPDLPVIWGGWHPSLFPVETLKEEASVDVTVQGQGEWTFKELVAALDNQAGLESIHGISWRQGARVVQNPARLMSDMNLLPPVNYSLIDVEAYFAKKGRRQLDYISSTGCLFRCTFCADPFVYERKWTALSPERLGEELQRWKDAYGFTDLNFQDETFFTYRKRVIGVAKEMIQRKLNCSWAATMRADQGHRLSDEDLVLLKQSGLRRLLIGVESGSQEMIDWMQKDIKLEHVIEMAERCCRLGIQAIFPFIVGFPGETEASVRASLAMAARLRQMDPGFTTPVFYFKPYPGSKITSDVVKTGFKLPNSLEAWADFDYIGSAGPWLSAQQFREVERFKFYNFIAGTPAHWALRPLQALARWRLKRLKFQFPIERVLISAIRRPVELS